MRQYNGGRVLSSDVSSGRTAAPVVRTGPRAARTGKRDDRNIPQSCRYALRASALARSTEAQMSLFLLDEACIVYAIWA